MKFIIKKPLVTEKNTLLQGKGVYVFECEKTSSKPEIQSAVEAAFGVKVMEVNTVMCRGKSRRTRAGLSKPKYWKKAFVTLKEGDKISLFEGV